MKVQMFAFWSDEQGFIISAELVLVLTICVLAVVVGLHTVAKSVNGELNDVASAFGALNQSYSYNGMTAWGHASVGGSAFIDAQEFCDCTLIYNNGAAGKGQGYGGISGGYGYEQGTIRNDAACPGGDCPPAAAAPCDGCEPSDAPLNATPESFPAPSENVAPPATLEAPQTLQAPQ